MMNPIQTLCLLLASSMTFIEQKRNDQHNIKLALKLPRKLFNDLLWLKPTSLSLLLLNAKKKVNSETAYLLPGILVEVPLNIQVAQCDPEVGVDVGSAALPSGSALLQTEHGLGELEAKVAERAQGHWGHRGEDAPPEETLWKKEGFELDSGRN